MVNVRAPLVPADVATVTVRSPTAAVRSMTTVARNDVLVASDAMIVVPPPLIDMVVPPGRKPVPVNVRLTVRPRPAEVGLILVNVGAAGGGPEGRSRIWTVCVSPPADAEMLTSVSPETPSVVIVKVLLVAPAGIVMDAGTCASRRALDSVTTVPPAGAAPLRATVPRVDSPPRTLSGSTVKEARVGAAGAGSVGSVAADMSSSAAVRVAPPVDALMVTLVVADTDSVVTVKVPLVAPAAIVIDSGTTAAAALLDNVTAVPPAGAAPLSVTVPCVAVPPVTIDGSIVRAVTAMATVAEGTSVVGAVGLDGSSPLQEPASTTVAATTTADSQNLARTRESRAPLGRTAGVLRKLGARGSYIRRGAVRKPGLNDRFERQGILTSLMPWQKRARFAVAIFGIAFAGVVYFAIGERQAAAPGPRPAGLEPEVILESAGAVLRQFREAKQDYVIEAERQLAYEGGATRLEGVTITVRQRSGRDFVVTGREAHAGENQEELEITGGVKLQASDGFVMTTDAATFRQSDATVQVPGSVSFSKGLMSGSGMGMSYDQDKDVLVLAKQAHVEMKDQTGRTVTDFTAGSATLARRENYLALEERVHVLRGEQVLEADRGLARLTDDEAHITFIELRGSARVAGGGAFDEMTARDIDLDYTEDGQTLERVVLTGDGVIAMLGGNGAAGRQFRGESLDVTFASDASLTSAKGRQKVRVDLPAVAAAPARSVTARAFDAAGEPGAGLTSARFADDVEYREDGAPEARTQGSAVSDKDPRAASAARIARSRTLRIGLAGDVVTAAVFAGQVRFEERGLRASAATAEYDPSKGTLRLSGADQGGGPRVADDQVAIEADGIDVTLEGRRMTAAGSVKTTLRPRTAGGKLPGLLKQDEAATVNAGTLDYQGDSGRATFTGSATLVQGQTAVRGSVLVIDQASGDLVASAPATSTLALDTGLSIGRAAEIRYQDTTRRISYLAPPLPAPPAVLPPALLAQVSGPEGDLRAAQIDVVLGETGGRAERLEAYGHVTARVDTRIATGDRLTYRTDAERYDMTGMATVPVRVVETCRETTGRTVTFFKSTERIIVDGQEEVRTQSKRGAPCSPPVAR